MRLVPWRQARRIRKGPPGKRFPRSAYPPRVPKTPAQPKTEGPRGGGAKKTPPRPAEGPKGSGAAGAPGKKSGASAAAPGEKPAAPAQAPAQKPARPPKPRPPRPARTLQPVPNDGRPAPDNPRIPSDERIGQWAVRGAPGVESIFGWDAEGVAEALRTHSAGSYRRSGLLLDDVRANPIIRHCNEVRQEAFRTLPRVFVPGRGEGAARFCDFWREVFPDILPDGTLDDWWLHHEYIGESVSGMDWEERTDGRDRWWLPVVKPWHPSQEYHMFLPKEGARTVDGQVLVAVTREKGPCIVEEGWGRWVRIARGTLAPWLNGLIRALGEPYLGDTYTLRDVLALQERYGQGVTKFFHPVEWSDQQVDGSLATVRSSGRGGVIGCPTTADGKRRVDLENLAVDAGGNGLFDLTERRLTRRFLIALLGQDMTTTGSAGGFAQAVVHSAQLWHKRERDAAAFGDARLIVDFDDAGKMRRRWIPYNGPIRSQIARWVAWYNAGSFDAAPYSYWDATPPEDLSEKQAREATAGSQRAATLGALVAALPQLREVYPDVEPAFLFEQCGIQLFRDPEAGIRSMVARLPPERARVLLRLFADEYLLRA